VALDLSRGEWEVRAVWVLVVASLGLCAGTAAGPPLEGVAACVGCAPAVRSAERAPLSRTACVYRRGGFLRPPIPLPTQSAEPTCRQSTSGPARPGGKGGEGAGGWEGLCKQGVGSAGCTAAGALRAPITARRNWLGVHG
jgi:hypothetical protein